MNTIDTISAIKCRLITNPRSGLGGADLSAPLAILREHGWDVSIRQKLHGGHATELASEAVQEGCQVVVNCGGDGTLSEIVAGVLGSETAVGELPGGTANLWSREVGVAARLEVAARQLISAERRPIDVGELTVNGKHKSHFVLMAGVGIDGAIVERVNKKLKNRVGRVAVGVAALQALPVAHAVPVRVEMDDLHWEGRVAQVIIGNTRRYGGLGAITADALVDDGLFDVCLMTPTGVLSTARALGALLLRRRLKPAVAQYYRAAHITITTPVTLAMQADGGSIHLEDEESTSEGTRYEFALLARGVTMLVPRTYNGALFQAARLANLAPQAPLRPVTIENAEQHNGAGDSHSSGAGKEKRWRMTILEVGVASLTAARVKNGHVVHVTIGPDTTLADDGDEKPLLGALSSLRVGDTVRVTGRKNGDAHSLFATCVKHLGRE
jgi:YegS/Rv2252/BmrU family lipid kinase